MWFIAVFAPFCLIASDLPRAWAWPLAVTAALIGVRDARRYWRQPRRRFVIPAGRGAPTCDEMPIQGLDVRWRGPLAFLRWGDGDGRVRRLAFAPDLRMPAARRELKLAMQRREAATGSPSMAG